MKKITAQEAMYKASALCSTTEYCPADIQQRLQKWGVPEDTGRDIVRKLMDEDFINEERYCRAFIHDKLNYNKWGRRKIQEALRLKRIAGSIVSTSLQEIDSEHYEQILKNLLTAKNKEIKAESTYERNGKLMRFAMGRGFEAECISRLLPECYDEQG
jgi:recX family